MLTLKHIIVFELFYTVEKKLKRRDKHLHYYGLVMRELTRAKQDNLSEVCSKWIISQNVNKWLKLYLSQLSKS